MKIAYVVSMFPCWSETFILNELVDHRRAGVELCVFSLKRCSETMVHQEAEAFIADTVYPATKMSLVASHLRLMAQAPLIYLSILLRLLSLKGADPLVKLKALAVFLLAPPFVFAGKARRIERLHAHFATYPALLAWIAASFLKIPFTFTAHAHDIYVNQDLLPIVCGTAAEIVVISEYNRRFIVEKLGEEFAAKITVIHCGIDLNRLPFAERRVRREGALRLVSIGRLSGIKGFTFLIEALRLLQKTGCDFCCTIVGDGPLRKELERQVAEAGLSDRVDLVGSKKAEEIPPILQTADLFVLACAKDRIEGQDGIPVVFMEAMAQGLPVLGTRLSGIPELIRHEETGLLAQPHDPADLMRQIRFFSENPAAAEAMRAKARALVEAEFDAAKNCRLLRESVFCCNEAPSAVTV